MTKEVPLALLNDEIDRRLLEARRIFFSEPVTMESATEVIRHLWYLDLQNPEKPIQLIINSPGGSVDAGFAIWDQINLIKAPVITCVTGIAASMGSILSLVAPKGKRFATANARIMIHQPAVHGALTGQATDLEIHAREILKTRDKIIDIYTEATGKDRDLIAKSIDRDTWLSPEEAIEFGLIDKLVNSYDEIA